MLVLTRKIGEEIYIDNGRVKIKVLFRRGRTFAVGIQAPKEVDILRKEVYLRNQEQESQ